MSDTVQQPEHVNVTQPNDLTTINDSQSGDLSRLSSINNFSEQLSKINRKFFDFSEQLPRYTVKFYNEYKLPIISFTLLVVVVTAFNILLAVVNAINDIPLVSPIFELMGVGYVIWFVARYFIKASTRQELAGEINSIKKQITDENVS